MNNPKVSVCIPAYNRPEYLREAIVSVLKQAFRDFELIISDDCSPTDLKKIVAEFSDNRIKYFRQPKNLGFIKNWNFCLSRCSGQFIKIMGDDDVLLANCLDDQTKRLDYKNIGLVCSNLVVIDETGQIINNDIFKTNSYKLFTSDARIDGKFFIKEFLLGKIKFGLPSSVLFKANLAQKCGFFDETIGCPTDIDMWLRILKLSDFYYSDNVVLKARIHGENLSKKLNNEVFSYKNNLKVLYKHKDIVKRTNLKEKILIFKLYSYSVRKIINFKFFREAFSDLLNLFLFIFI